MSLDGKVALVTGGAQGIGQAYSERVAREGAAVAIVDLRIEQAHAVAGGIRDRGGRAAAYRADVSSQEQMDTAVTEVVQEFGRVDILINNAAIYYDFDGRDQSLEYLRKVLDVNLIGLLVCARAVFPAMKQQRGGSIINISSIAAYPWPWQRVGEQETVHSYAYGLGKWGVIYYTQQWARSLGQYGVRVNAIAPGVTMTEATIRRVSDEFVAAMTSAAALGRMLEPTDLAGVVVFLASDDAALITGQTLVVDGGTVMLG
jgi:3-oxoacyl-[acyl-carrier protein] reductase